ncbi:hypothetical protein HNP49_002341 [Pseudomonas fluvialis]|uniref:Transmembrane protein n=1 Tax=Pseudomonas fluvialis TaxID=1793966 RepID=A0A7X0BSP6_9PSED|nr:hypothetical protein [Pseudomonas fluvialis]MBB6342159.1 hypothetical protein [Pseudomonas fluvialis]
MMQIKNKRLHITPWEGVLYICLSVVSFYWAEEIIVRYDFWYYFVASQILCLMAHCTFGEREGWIFLLARFSVILIASVASNFMLESIFVSGFWETQLRWLEENLVLYGKGLLFSGLIFGGWLPATGLAITKMLKALITGQVYPTAN